MRLYKHLILSFLVLGLTTLRASAQMKPQTNIVVVLDLSDRLLRPHQTDGDLAAIEAAFARFEASVKSHLFIDSKDAFSVVIVPQKGSRLDMTGYENKLRLDLESVSFKEKKDRFLAFRTALTPTLRKLYAEAGQGKRTADCFGVDLWKFMNQSLNSYLKPNTENRVLLVTDGYLDFESFSHTNKQANRFTSSSFFSKVNGPTWKADADRQNLGLLPLTNRLLPHRLTVAGFQPKGNGQFELDKLKHFWTKWLQESGVRPFTLLENVNPGQLKSLVMNNL